MRNAIALAISLSLPLRYTLAVAIFTAALLIRFQLAPVESGLPFLTFYPALVIGFYCCGIGPGVLLAVLSAITASYIFIPPYWELDFRHDEIISALSFLVSAGMIGYVVQRMQEYSKELTRRLADLEVSEQQLRVAATAFEAQEGMLITDANALILQVNKAFTEITGYASDEVIGKNPHLLNSGLQDAIFYTAMWKKLQDTGSWEGEIFDRTKSGHIYPEHLAITAVKRADGSTSNYVGTFTDISQSKVAQAKIEHLAYFDSLTQLPNRQLLLDRLQQALSSCKRSGKIGAVLYLDLDNFKTINDTLGHDVGDLLLQQVAARLAFCVRENDTIARMGGDEFIVILEDLSETSVAAASRAESVGSKILATLNQPYDFESRPYYITASIGITLFDKQNHEMEELLKQADLAIYQAKNAGHHCFRFFDPQMQDSINARVAMESDLRLALASNQFRLYYQMQIDKDGKIIGAEALLRWQHPKRGMIPPADFIPLAEESGLILPIGQWVLETGCGLIKAWQQSKLTRHLVLSINVSAKQFHQSAFVAQVQAAVQGYGVEPGQLKLELTESMLLEDIEDIAAKMTALQEIGIQFSLDDFGTGYSSLQYLKRLPINQLKIDQSFVRDIAVNTSDQSIVRTIIAMAETLNLNVIAEGVETEEQRQLLLDNGCSHYQGYLFSRPLPIEEFESLLHQ